MKAILSKKHFALCSVICVSNGTMGDISFCSCYIVSFLVILNSIRTGLLFYLSVVILLLLEFWEKQFLFQFFPYFLTIILWDGETQEEEYYIFWAMKVIHYIFEASLRKFQTVLGLLLSHWSVLWGNLSISMYCNHSFYCSFSKNNYPVNLAWYGWVLLMGEVPALQGW